MSGPGLLLIVVAFGFLYFILVRPQKRRQQESQRMLTGLSVGDEIVTAGGIYGRVAELHDDAILVEIAPNLRVKLARRAVGAVIPPEEPEEADEPEDDAPSADDGG